MVLIAIAASCLSAKADSMNRQGSSVLPNTDQQAEFKDMDTVFRQAVTSYGAEYLKAESQLRADPHASNEILLANRAHPDPVVALMVGCLLRWIQGGAPAYQQALDYLDSRPREVLFTPLIEPDAVGVANSLSRRFGAHAAELLSVRLVKEIDSPGWKKGAILIYLEQQKLSSTTAAVIRFAAQSADADDLNLAISTIEAINDPDLQEKIEYEKRRIEAEGLQFPQALADLAQKKADR